MIRRGMWRDSLGRTRYNVSGDSVAHPLLTVYWDGELNGTSRSALSSARAPE